MSETLSLKEMKDIIRRGESVLYRGTVISSENIEELPSEAELALYNGDKRVIESTKDSIEEELIRLQAQLNILNVNNNSDESNLAAVVSNTNDAEIKKGRSPKTV